MTTPLSVQEQLSQSFYRPTTSVAILLANSSYDQVWTTDEEGNPETQAFPDNNQAISDAVQIRTLI